MNDKEVAPTKRTLGDSAHALTKAGLSMVPFVGGLAVELFQYVIQPPLEKRREEWMCEIGERLLKLEEQGLNLEELQGNEHFVSTVMLASQAALRTHSQEKLAALRNAVINVAEGRSPEETRLHLLLRFVDELSEVHLRILNLAHSPARPQGLYIGGWDTVLEYHIPSLVGQKEISKLLWNDLYVRGLVKQATLYGTRFEREMKERQTTDLGKDLLGFISESNA